MSSVLPQPVHRVYLAMREMRAGREWDRIHCNSKVACHFIPVLSNMYIYYLIIWFGLFSFEVSAASQYWMTLGAGVLH